MFTFKTKPKETPSKPKFGVARQTVFHDHKDLKGTKTNAEGPERSSFNLENKPIVLKTRKYYLPTLNRRDAA